MKVERESQTIQVYFIELERNEAQDLCDLIYREGMTSNALMDLRKAILDQSPDALRRFA